MSDLRSLYELADYQNGRAFKPAETTGKSGLPVVKIAEMNKGITSTTGWFAGVLDTKHTIAAGDLLFAWSGTIVVQNWEGPSAALNQHVFKVTAKPGIDQAYLKYLLMSEIPFFNRLVADQRTTMGHVKVADLRKRMVVLPPLAEQKRIASVLSALDELTGANLAAARECADLRQTLIRLARSEATETLPLSSTASFVNGKNFTKDPTGTGRAVIRTPELRRGPSESTVFNDVVAVADNLASPGDLLFVWSGSLLVDRWLHDEALVNQHIFKVIPKSPYPDWLVNGLIEWQMPMFLGLAADKATTMGHIQRGHLDREVPMPDPDALARLEALVRPLWDQELLLRQECLQLEKTRDELVPRLIDGTLRVREATV